MTGSEANRLRVLTLLNAEREQILEHYRYIDITSTAVRRGKPPMSETTVGLMNAASLIGPTVRPATKRVE